jgi:hypothetical protein
MADAAEFKVLAAYVDDPTRSSWEDGPPGWRQWVEANCKSRDDVLTLLRQALPAGNSAALGVQFVDTDGRTYSLQVRIGPWFQITRWVDYPGGGLDVGAEAAFAHQPDLYRLVRDWRGQEDAEPGVAPDHPR